MLHEQSSKVKKEHLQLNAYLYVRQSTIRQVVENTESTKRQYALREKAVSLGWSTDNIIVIDSDLGKSGNERDREGFKKLMAEVGLGKAGIVMGLEVSRLARNSIDWQRLIEICAFSKTLILDEDGIYEPALFNDRLLLGLKGTMSEAELHLIRARLQGGIENKAKRGELKIRLPIGLMYNEKNEVILDPDEQIRNAVNALFDAFQRTGSAVATVKFFREKKLKFPSRIDRGLNKGEIVWISLHHSRTLQVLHNPRYAGTFVYGRQSTKKDLNGKTTTQRKLNSDEWQVVLPNQHVGYISWETFQANQTRLSNNAFAHGLDRRNSPPREGLALLQGIVICGVCGKRMTVTYKQLAHKLVPQYICRQREGVQNSEKRCQYIPGRNIDEAIAKILFEVITPFNIDVTLEVEKELKQRFDEADKLLQQQIERARYEADLAKRRYMLVDPGNRLVAATLEGEWNGKLREFQQAKEDYEHKRQSCLINHDKIKQETLLLLANDFEKVWSAEGTSSRDKKRLLRYIIEDVTLRKAEQITVSIRFNGGATKELTIPPSLPSYKTWQTDQKVIDEIDRLLDFHVEKEIANKLNDMGYRSGKKLLFTPLIVRMIKKRYGIKSRYARLREMGLLTMKEMALELNLSTVTIRRWYRNGLIRGEIYGNNGRYLLYPLTKETTPVKNKRKSPRKK